MSTPTREHAAATRTHGAASDRGHSYLYDARRDGAVVGGG